MVDEGAVEAAEKVANKGLEEAAEGAEMAADEAAEEKGSFLLRECPSQLVSDGERRIFFQFGPALSSVTSTSMSCSPDDDI